MNRLCDTAIKCRGQQPGLEGDFPVTNYSAETTDGTDFPGIRFVNVNPYDPQVPRWWSSEACEGQYVYISYISQADAEFQAQLLADACAWTPPVSAPPPPNGGGDGFPPLPIYRNATQTCGVACPDGTTTYVSITAGLISATSQSVADQVAYQTACRLAAYYFICVFGFTGRCCKDAGYLENFTANGRGAPFTMSVESGTLPPGVSFEQTGERTGRFIGSPTQAGDFAVTVRIASSLGHTVAKVFNIHVLGITNNAALPTASVGVAYNEALIGAGGTPPYTFSLVSGSLPAGLTLSAAGVISGTPTAAENPSFSIQIQDSTP